MRRCFIGLVSLAVAMLSFVMVAPAAVQVLPDGYYLSAPPAPDKYVVFADLAPAPVLAEVDIETPIPRKDPATLDEMLARIDIRSRADEARRLRFDDG